MGVYDKIDPGFSPGDEKSEAIYKSILNAPVAPYVPPTQPAQPPTPNQAPPKQEILPTQHTTTASRPDKSNEHLSIAVVVLIPAILIIILILFFRRPMGKLSVFFIALVITALANLALHIPFIYFTGNKLPMLYLSMFNAIVFIVSFVMWPKKQLQTTDK
jgi:hypothetical protein